MHVDLVVAGAVSNRPAVAASGWPLQRVLFMALLVVVGCLLGAAAGTALRFPVVGAAIWFPPYAVLTAALLATPLRWWWVMVLAAALGNFSPHVTHSGSISFVLLAEVANATRALVAAAGIRLLAGASGRLSTLRGMTMFLVFAAVVAPVIGAFMGAADVMLHHRATSFWLAWQAWLLSNALTGVTLLPAIVLAGRNPMTWITGMGARRFFEAAALSIGLLAIGTSLLDSESAGALPISLYGPVPFLLWAAVRFGPAGATAALSAMTIVTIHGAITGRGPFVAAPAADNLLQLQFSLIAISAPMLLLAAVVAENKQAMLELRRGEMQYRTVVEDQTELICRFLSDGTYTFVNGAYCRYFGRSQEELLGRTFWMFIPEDDRAAPRRALDSITRERPIATVEHRVVERGGSVRWQQWTNRGLFDREGRLVEYQSVGRDVTDRKRAEEEHQQLESQRRVEEVLRETDRRKDEFLAMLAHELRNPLAPLSFALEIIRSQEPADRRMARAQGAMSRQVRHLARLVDDLTDISRITQGKITLKQEPLDLARVTADAVDNCRTVIDEHGHELTISLPHAPVAIRGDSVRLIQIITNLLNNAAKYTRPGGRIELTLTREGSQAVLSVRDNGVGIEPEMLPQIFDLFTQGRHGSDATHGGLGIGLTLVRRLVALHEGQVEARSLGAERGSEFIVRLPAIEQVAVDGDIASPHATIDGPPLRVLVVDDNVDAAECLAELLATWGHTVHMAHDGPSALTAEAVFAPHAALLDLGLPQLDGLEVARRLREKRPPPSLLLVAITGLGQKDDLRRSAAAGFDHHCVKPVDGDELRSILSTWAVATSQEGVRRL
jgi:two-component system CheB/CheR fusion protein